MSKRCLFGVRDDLQAYAERMCADLEATCAAAPIDARDYDGFTTAVVHRAAPFQTELVEMKPGLAVPQHTHPGVDSIECQVRGLIRLVIDGVDLFAGIDDARAEAMARGRLVRIGQGAWHGGAAGPRGATFLSMQRWSGTLAAIAERWRGRGVPGRHAEFFGG